MYLLKGLLILKVPDGMMATNAVKVHFAGTIQVNLYHKVVFHHTSPSKKLLDTDRYHNI